MLQKNSAWQVFALMADGDIHHVRTLARKLSVSQTKVRAALQQLVKEGLVKRVQGEFFSGYKLITCDSTLFWKRVLIEERIRSCGIVDKLVEALAAQAIILFGSCARGEYDAASDIDLCVIGNGADADLQSFKRKLGRKVHLQSVRDIWKISGPLRVNILNGIRLYGYIDVPYEEARPAQGKKPVSSRRGTSR